MVGAACVVMFREWPENQGVAVQHECGSAAWWVRRVSSQFREQPKNQGVVGATHGHGGVAWWVWHVLLCFGEQTEHCGVVPCSMMVW